MDKLVVVSATLGADPEKDENAGCTFICDAGAKGRKPYLFGGTFFGGFCESNCF